jgi:predicted MFS family arabinose efflux permease
VSEATAGYLTAGYAAMTLVTVIPLSKLLSRIPRHFLLVALILTFAASNALVAIVSDFGSAMGSRVVGGKALAIVFSGNSLGLAIAGVVVSMLLLPLVGIVLPGLALPERLPAGAKGTSS